MKQDYQHILKNIRDTKLLRLCDINTMKIEDDRCSTIFSSFTKTKGNYLCRNSSLNNNDNIASTIYPDDKCLLIKKNAFIINSSII